MQKPYYLSIIPTTTSVSCAVTDENYNLIRKNGKDLWWDRSYNEADTAENTRVKRTSRRRKDREKARLGLLKSYFEEEILKEDPLFFIRMDNSKFFPEDKDESLKENKNVIFNDDDYKDYEYKNEYPTIFHLKSKLIHDGLPFDRRYARFVYLALHNSFKHRGHFLNPSLSCEEVTGLDNLLHQLEDMLSEKLELTFKANTEDFISILSNDKVTNSFKAKQLEEIATGNDKMLFSILNVPKIFTLYEAV